VIFWELCKGQEIMNEMSGVWVGVKMVYQGMGGIALVVDMG